MSDGAPLGEIIYSAVKPMIRLYMILFTGFGLTRAGLFGVQTARACSDLVLMVFMPALVFDKIVSYISISDIKTIGVICFSAVVMYGINSCFAALIVTFTPVPKDPKGRWVGGALLAGIMQNVSDLPIAYIQAMSLFTTDQQNKGVAYVIIWLAMYVLAQFNIGLFKLVEWDFSYARKAKLNKENDPEETPSTPSIEEDDEEKEAEGDGEDQHQGLSITASYDSECPSSLRSSISTEQSSIRSDLYENDSHILHAPTNKSKRRRSSGRSLEPVALNLNKIATALSQQSRHSALHRIPSARVNSNINGGDALSLTGELVREYSHVEPYNQQMSKAMKIVTDTDIKAYNEKTNDDGANTNKSFVKRYHLEIPVFFLQNFKKPNSISLIVSIIIALIPWLKALFTDEGTVVLPNAPDGEAPLSFVLMYAEYLGYPCVPLGVMLIGSVLARLEINNLPKGFWKSALCHTTYRLCILPIIGMAYVSRLKHIGWLTDPMALFVTSLQFGLPSATVQVYLTAAAMDPDDDTCPALNCLGLYLICQYCVLVISLPIVACYCVKNVLDM